VSAETPQEWKARIGVGQPSNIARRVGGPGRTHTSVVMDETRPRVAGTITDHWDGRRDACVTPETVRVKGGGMHL
jgi:hypothetical protein